MVASATGAPKVTQSTGHKSVFNTRRLEKFLGRRSRLTPARLLS